MTREELKEEMKKASAMIWQRGKEFLHKYGLYSMLGLSLSPSTAEQSQPIEQNQEYTQSLAEGDKKLNNRLKITDMKEKINAPIQASAYSIPSIEWEEALNVITQASWKTDTQKAEEVYKKIESNLITGEVSIEKMMEQAGVTQADIQSVIARNPELVHQISPGETQKKLSRAASRNEVTGTGSCTYGVQQIFGSAGMGALVDGGNPNWPEKERGAGGSNSGCNTYLPLEKSGKFITLKFPNKAYTHSTRRDNKEAENREMKDFIKKLPEGSTISIANKVDEFQGRRLPSGNNAGIIHGHTGVIDKHGVTVCDHRQEDGPNFCRYGNELRVSISKDSRISKEFALECIKQAQARQNMQDMQKYQTNNRG